MVDEVLADSESSDSSDDDSLDDDSHDSPLETADALHEAEAFARIATGAGGDTSTALQRQRAEAAMGAVRFITAGQQCWDWFMLQRGHVTSSVASQFISLGTSIVKCAPGTVALRQLMGACPQRLIDAWHGARRGSHFTLDAPQSGAAISAQLSLDTNVDGLFEAGLAESKAERWLAASPDAVGGVHVGYLCTHLREALGQAAVEATSPLTPSLQHLPFVFKTLAMAGQLEYERIAAGHATEQGWQVCSMDSPGFKTLIPDSDYRCQLVHLAATFKAPAVVFVAATERYGNAVTSKTLVVASERVVARHVAVYTEGHGGGSGGVGAHSSERNRPALV